MTTKAEGRWTRWVLWLSGLLVALGAGATTAHGLFEVALAADVPAGIAWLYPVITDGLALVAYVSTARLTDGGRSYAWAVVVLAAGLSGLAQAAYLAGGVADAAVPLRFGIGAWPAIAAAIVAHLLFLLGSHAHAATGTADVQLTDVQAPAAPVQPTGVQPSVHQPVQATAVRDGQPFTPDPAPGAVERRASSNGSAGPDGLATAPARDRARSAARRHASLHGSLPTVSRLQTLANVARGTASAALKELREQPTQLHVVNDTDKEITQP